MSEATTRTKMRFSFQVLAMSTLGLLVLACVYAYQLGPGWKNNATWDGLIMFAPMGAICLFGLAGWGNSKIRPTELAGFVACCLCVVVSVAVFTGPTISDHLLASNARATLARATRVMGTTPSDYDYILAATQTRQSTQANRKMLAQVAAARTDEQSLIIFISAANMFGVDAGFVSRNGMVRPQDQKALLDAAATRAASGNALAALWLARTKEG